MNNTDFIPEAPALSSMQVLLGVRIILTGESGKDLVDIFITLQQKLSLLFFLIILNKNNKCFTPLAARHALIDNGADALECSKLQVEQ